VKNIHFEDCLATLLRNSAEIIDWCNWKMRDHFDCDGRMQYMHKHSFFWCCVKEDCFGIQIFDFCIFAKKETMLYKILAKTAFFNVATRIYMIRNGL